MEFGKYSEIEYCVFDPTGNITALVETAVDAADQPAVASRIMELEPDVEQVGFVTFEEAEGTAPVALRMAGGEFCGNATMCAAALHVLRSGLPGGTFQVKVSGASAPLEVKLGRQAANSFSAAVCMPPALGIEELALKAAESPALGIEELCFSAAGQTAATEPSAAAHGPADRQAGGGQLTLPLVKMQGISHIIVEPDSGFFGLKDDPVLAEALLRNWCGALGADCLGMMFLGEGTALAPATELQGHGTEALEYKAAGALSSEAGTSVLTTLRTLIPLVYVPGADTMFWENSCASGSAAAGMYMAAKSGVPIDVTFDEPAGKLRVASDPSTGRTVLHGSLVLKK